jgi:HlyD family secretion protein
MVSFVSPEAQFTPKEVETRSEREKLMFRVKIQVPRALVMHYVERIKTGVRGVGYVKIDDEVAWPEWLQRNLVRPEEAKPQPVSQILLPFTTPRK